MNIEKKLEQDAESLRNALAVWFHENGKRSIKHEIEAIENDVPYLLRFLADYYKEHEPNAKREIDVLEECADTLESLHLPEVPDDYWTWAAEIGIAE